jgi:hypothetical protein
MKIKKGLQILTMINGQLQFPVPASPWELQLAGKDREASGNVFGSMV